MRPFAGGSKFIFFAWINRFLLIKMNTWGGVFSVVTFQSIVEIVLRQLTWRAIDGFFCVPCKKEKLSLVSTTRLTRHSQMLLLEHYSEYVAIIGAPFITIMFYNSKMFYDFNYRKWTTSITR